MKIDTEAVLAADRQPPQTDVIDVADDDEPMRVDKSDEQLLAWLDTQFGPMLERCRSTLMVEAGMVDEVLSPAQRLLAEQQARRAQDDAALVAFRAQRPAHLVFQPKVRTAAARQPELIKCKNGRVMIKARTGLGPRLYIGFDAEWTQSRPGHNRIDSVQFVVYGPTGQTYEHLVDLSGDHDIDQRVTLGDSLDLLLDKAEQACVFDDWPHEIVLVGFFIRGDITAFADFSELRGQLDGISGTLGTVSKPATLTLPMDEERQARLKHRYRLVLGSDFDPRQLNVRIIDASKLTPPGASLEKVGQWMEQPKITLPPGYSKSDMRTFKRRDPDAFREYALHDARLAVRYALWVLWFADRHLGLKGLSATVSGLAVRLAELCMREDGVHPDVALNYTKARSVVWDPVRHRPITRSKRVPTDIRRWLEPFLSDAYAGGRNEAYVYGPSEVQTWYDSDLSGAYLTGLAVCMTLDYDNVEWTKDVQALIGPGASFAKLDFEFPPGTEFPCLSVPMGTGLGYPLKGESLCTGPEIELALAMGAKLVVRVGLVIPFKPRAQVFAESAPRLKRWQTAKQRRAAKRATPTLQRAKRVSDGELGDQDVLIPPVPMNFPPPDHGDEGYRPMESFAIFVRQLRLKFKRKSLPFEFAKLVGNGLYGKTGQGFKRKGAFGPKEMGTVVIGPSRVSEPAIAALVCGFVRAAMGEVLWRRPAGSKVLSLTTDGALMSVPIDQLDLTGAICRRYQALVDRVAPGTLMMEAKHQVRQVFIPRTRGCFTVELDGDHPAMCAKAGHKVVIPDGASDAEHARLRTPEGESDWMIRLALNRSHGQKLPQESFFSLREQLLNGWDLQKQIREVAVSLEYDFKRRPVNPRMVRMAPYQAEHLAFDTVPWNTVEDALTVREVFLRWREENSLKTMADWHHWQATMVAHLGNRKRRLWRTATPCDSAAKVKGLRGATGQKHLRGGEAGPLRLVVRTFLAAFTQEVWGLADEKAAWSYKRLSQWLTEQGYPVTESDIKNAKRSRIDEGIAAETPEVGRFLGAMKKVFPGLEVERFFIVH